MDVTWYVADIVTGQVVGELPFSAGGDGNVERRVATVLTASLNLPTADDKCPADWDAILVAGKTMVVLCIDQRPVQGWAVDDYTPGTSVVPVSCSTFETFADRTNVPDFPALDDFSTDIGATDLSEVAAAVADPLVTRFGVTIEWTPCGTTNPDLPAYDNTQDQGVLDALNALMAADNGPEWRIYPRWVDESTRRAFDKVLEIGPKIGSDRPDVVFDLDSDGRGNINSYTRPTSFAKGKGATMIVGTSDGSGSSRPMTDPLYSDKVLSGWPIWEERVNFTGLDSTDDPDAALLSRATATLKLREAGAVTWQFTGDTDSPVPGVDYNEGDTVRVVVAPQGKADPIGGTSSPRVLGWTIDPDTGLAVPLLWDPDDTDGGA